MRRRRRRRPTGRIGASRLVSSSAFNDRMPEGRHHAGVVHNTVTGCTVAESFTITSVIVQHSRCDRRAIRRWQRVPPREGMQAEQKKPLPSLLRLGRGVAEPPAGIEPATYSLCGGLFLLVCTSLLQSLSDLQLRRRQAAEHLRPNPRLSESFSLIPCR